jgi:hypothetical protein
MTDKDSPAVGSGSRLDTSEAFWRHYVNQHRDPLTRRLHFAGTLLAILSLAGAILWQSVWLALAVPVVAYGFAWVSHVAVERNSPATFRHPLRSLVSDLRMFGLMCLGRMDDEVKRITGDRTP